MRSERVASHVLKRANGTVIDNLNDKAFWARALSIEDRRGCSSLSRSAKSKSGKPDTNSRRGDSQHIALWAW